MASATTSGITVLCEGLEFPEGPVAMPDGSIILVEIAGGCLTRVSATGKRSVVATLGGGPNGAARGPDGAIYVCNAGGSRVERGAGFIRISGQSDDYSGGRIERVDPDTGRFDRLYDRCDGNPLKAPNDLVFDRNGGFYFTDLGKTRDRDRDRGGVYYATIDGTTIREVIHPISMPNGIGLSADEATLYVAETETGRLWSWPVVSPGRVTRLPHLSLNGGTFLFNAGGVRRFDSLAVESSGRVCVATLGDGGITVVDPSGGTPEFVPMPDEHTTNICFGGDDLRTAYVTLSSTGRLVRLRWPRPGLRLNFSTSAS